MSDLARLQEISLWLNIYILEWHQATVPNHCFLCFSNLSLACCKEAYLCRPVKADKIYWLSSKKPVRQTSAKFCKLLKCTAKGPIRENSSVLQHSLNEVNPVNVPRTDSDSELGLACSNHCSDCSAVDGFRGNEMPLYVRWVSFGACRTCTPESLQLTEPEIMRHTGLRVSLLSCTYVLSYRMLSHVLWAFVPCLEPHVCTISCSLLHLRTPPPIAPTAALHHKLRESAITSSQPHDI